MSEQQRLPYVRQRDEERLQPPQIVNDDHEQRFPTHQRFRVVVSYDGTDFCGWQVQQQQQQNVAHQHHRHRNNNVAGTMVVETIQSRIEQRLSQVFCSGARAGVTIAGSGRTDAGVHAAGQVFHFDAPRVVRLPEKKLNEDDGSSSSSGPGGDGGGGNKTKRVATVEMKESLVDAAMVLKFLRSGLPPSIQVLSADAVPPSFHARESCLKKRYEYTVCEGTASPFDTRYCYSLLRGGHPQQLDVERMNEAAQRLLGQHDFSAFAVIEDGDRRSPVKNMTMLRVERRRRGGSSEDDNGSDDARVPAAAASSSSSSSSSFVTITAECDRFLYHMMRMISGTLIDVGLGRLSPDDVEELLKGQARGEKHQTARVRVTMAPAQGLKLIRVYYAD